MNGRFKIAATAFLGLSFSHAFSMNFNETAKRCAPDVHHNTLQAVVRVESVFNPYAIGVVAKKGEPYPLRKQPKSLVEALAVVDMLESRGYNYSMGLGQINKHNFKWLGLTKETVFEPCKNLSQNLYMEIQIAIMFLLFLHP